MHNIYIPATGKNYDFPQYIYELTEKQYAKYCYYFCLLKSNKISFFETKVLLVYMLLDMPFKSYKEAIYNTDIKNENIYRLTQAVESLFELEQKQNKLVIKPSLNFSENKTPKIKIKKTLLIGPDDMYLNIRYKEHMDASDEYRQFIETGDEHCLNRLVAILYRPHKNKTRANKIKGYEGDKRISYYPATVEKRAKQISNIPYHIKYGVYLWFMAMEEFIGTANDIVIYGQRCDFTVLFKKETKKQKSIGMPGVLFSLVKMKVIGNKSDTEKELYWTILLILLDNHIASENAKEKANVTT